MSLTFGGCEIDLVWRNWIVRHSRSLSDSLNGRCWHVDVRLVFDPTSNLRFPTHQISKDGCSHLLRQLMIGVGVTTVQDFIHERVASTLVVKNFGETFPQDVDGGLFDAS